MTQKQNINKGDFIISLPSANLIDLPFSRSIILLADYDVVGSVGFVLNKPLEITLNDLIPTTDAAYTIHEGGPVEQDKIFCVHKRPDLIPDCLLIRDDLYWGGDFDVIINLINDGLLTKEDIRFYLGYTGWDVEQLDYEIEDKYWIKANNLDYDTIFTSPSKNIWKKAIIEMGDEYNIWQNAPENPNFN